MVIGIGEPKASLALVEACIVFLSTDQLKQSPARAKSTKVSTVPVTPTAPLPATKQKSSLNTASPTHPHAELHARLTMAYQQATNGKESEWVLISQLGVVLRKINPS